MPEHSTAPLMTSAGAPNACPIGDERHAGEMRARRMAGHVDAVRIAAEARGILADPGDSAAHLLGHRHQVAAGLIDVDEVEHDEVRAGVHIAARRRSNAPWQARPATRRRARTLAPAHSASPSSRHRGLRWASSRRQSAWARRGAAARSGCWRCGACQAAAGSAHRPPGRRRRRAPSGPCSARPADLFRAWPARTAPAPRRQSRPPLPRCSPAPRQPLEHFRRHSTLLIRQTSFICSSTALPSRLSGLPIVSAISK